MKIKAYLAPMAGFTDVTFRRICTDFGCDRGATEMISAAAVCHNDKKTLELAYLSDDEAPAFVQLFGHDPAEAAEALERLLEYYCGHTPPVGVDINMGCPVKKIVSAGDGSALMRTPQRAASIVRALRVITERHGIMLSVKIRAGWDKNSINAPSFAAEMAEAGAQLVTVHGRTREQMYAPSADLSVIRAVREALPSDVIVVGNGDICTARDAERMICETGCDAVAVGRAALGNPWIFREIEALDRGESFKSPSNRDRVECALRLVDELVTRKGAQRGIREARGRAAHFIRGIRGSCAVRDSLNHSTSPEEFSEILNTLVRDGE